MLSCATHPSSSSNRQFSRESTSHRDNHFKETPHARGQVMRETGSKVMTNMGLQGGVADLCLCIRERQPALQEGPCYGKEHFAHCLCIAGSISCALVLVPNVTECYTSTLQNLPRCRLVCYALQLLHRATPSVTPSFTRRWQSALLRHRDYDYRSHTLCSACMYTAC